MGTLWNELLIRPMLNLLVFLQNIIPGHNIGIAIILVTFIIRFIILPLSLKSARAQRKIQQLTPQLNELKEKHKDNQQELAKAQMDFYKQNGINPAASCLPLIIQLPILFALYQVLIDGIHKVDQAQLYAFVKMPESINFTFIGGIDLSKPEKYFLPVLAGLLQYILTFMTTPKVDKTKKAGPEQMITRQMLYFMPLITVFIAIGVPAGIALYWVATTLFSIVQQLIVNHEKRREIKIKIKKASDGHEEISIVEEGNGTEEKPQN